MIKDEKGQGLEDWGVIAPPLNKQTYLYHGHTAIHMNGLACNITGLI